MKKTQWLNDHIHSVEEIAHYSLSSDKFVFFYSLGGLLDGAFNGHLDFINMLTHLFPRYGYKIILVDGTDLDRPLDMNEDAIHIWMIERPAIASNISNIFYCFPSYLYGYWYFDETGIRNNSSIYDKKFIAQNIDRKASQQFFNELKGVFVKPQKTKFDQEETDSAEIPDHCITIAVQTFASPTFYETYLDYPTLIEHTLQHRDGRAVVVKPHPLTKFNDAMSLSQFHNPDNGIYVEPFNLHQLLSKTDALITRCSAVAIEAMMHKVPAIVSGKVDFHHLMKTVHCVDDLHSAIQISLQSDKPFEKYLYWFFNKNLFYAENPKDCESRIIQLCEEKGLI